TDVAATRISTWWGPSAGAGASPIRMCSGPPKPSSNIALISVSSCCPARPILYYTGPRSQEWHRAQARHLQSHLAESVSDEAGAGLADRRYHKAQQRHSDDVGSRRAVPGHGYVRRVPAGTVACVPAARGHCEPEGR